MGNIRKKPLQIISSPSSNLNFDAGTSNNKLQWTAIDVDNPANYLIFKDGVQVVDNAWQNNSAITLTLNELLPRNYGFKIRVFDEHGFFVENSVIITVNTPPTPPPAHQASLTSPSDVTYYNTWNDITVDWRATYKNAAGVSWTWFINGIANQTGGLFNNTDYEFSFSVLNLQPGLHDLTFSIAVKDFNSQQFVYSDTVFANIIYQEVINTGKTDITLEGQSEPSIEIDVGSDVEVIITPSADAPTNESTQALEILTSDEGLAPTSFFIDI